MNLDVSALLFTIACSLISLVLAGIAANKKGKEWLASLNHPDNAFLPKVMPVLGFVFYGSFGYVLYHVFASRNMVCILLAAAVIQLNGIAALLLYKVRKLKLFLVICLLIPMLLVVILFILVQSNWMLAIIPIAYLLWLVYDFSYFYRLMKLNQ